MKTELRFGWLVPASLAITLAAGTFVGVESAILASPTQIVGVHAGAFGQTTGLDGRYLALFFGAPFAGLVATAGAYVGGFTRRPVIAAILATAGGLITAFAIGFETPSIGNWWGRSLPTDTNATALLLTLILVPPTMVSLVLVSEAIRTSAASTRRSHFLGLLTLSIAVGFVAGAYVGSVGGAQTLINSCSPYSAPSGCSTGDMLSVIESGGLLGSWVGSALGFVGAGIVWPFRTHRVTPSGDPVR